MILKHKPRLVLVAIHRVEPRIHRKNRRNGPTRLLCNLVPPRREAFDHSGQVAVPEPLIVRPVLRVADLGTRAGFDLVGHGPRPLREHHGLEVRAAHLQGRETQQHQGQNDVLQDPRIVVDPLLQPSSRIHRGGRSLILRSNVPSRGGLVLGIVGG